MSTSENSTTVAFNYGPTSKKLSELTIVLLHNSEYLDLGIKSLGHDAGIPASEFFAAVDELKSVYEQRTIKKTLFPFLEQSTSKTILEYLSVIIFVASIAVFFSVGNYPAAVANLLLFLVMIRLIKPHTYITAKLFGQQKSYIQKKVVQSDNKSIFDGHDEGVRKIHISSPTGSQLDPNKPVQESELDFDPKETEDNHYKSLIKKRKTRTKVNKEITEDSNLPSNAE